MGIDLYYMPESPPSRSVYLTATALGLDINLINVNLFKGEHKAPSFLKMNPQHQVPVINDNGFILSESCAIQMYLCNTYGKNSSLYPTDEKQRAIVEHRLFFSLGTLYPRHFNTQTKILYMGQSKVSEFDEKNLWECMDLIDGFIGSNPYIAGQHETIADHHIIPRITLLQVSGFDFSPWKNIIPWVDRCRASVKGFKEINDYGNEKYWSYIKKVFEERGFKWGKSKRY